MVLPSSALPNLFVAPVSKANASVNDVLPALPCETKPTFLMFSDE